MTSPQDQKEAEKSEAPMLDRILVYILCPALAILSVSFLVKSVLVSQQIVNDATAMRFSLWLLATSGSLLIFCLAAACWRTATAHAEKRARLREVGLQRRARYFEEMLRLIVDNIPNMIFISDREGRLWFANQATVPTGKDADEFIGKNIDRVFQQRHAQSLLERIRRAETVGAPVVTVDRRDDAAGPHYFETYHIPLPNTSDLHHTVMVTQKDITSMVVERERQEQMLTQIVDAMIAVVDRRDPYAAGHSLRVGVLAADLAAHRNLDETSIEACRIAGSLMNLGKIMVSRSILVKNTALDAEELKLVRKSILASADILSLISFQAPVIPTLRQVLERYDGKGEPEGRKGENILLTARIVALANAFIALVSPRAHRPGMSVTEALKILENDNGGAYDPRLVKALIEHLKQNPAVQEAVVRQPAEMKGIIPEKNLA